MLVAEFIEHVCQALHFKKLGGLPERGNLMQIAIVEPSIDPSHPDKLYNNPATVDLSGFSQR